MIQIIQYGSREVTTCKTCGCKFSYEKEDLHTEDTDDYKAFKEYVICPQCGHELITRAVH